MSEPDIPTQTSLPQVSQPQDSNALAIWALVMGVLCCAPVGVILGIIGLTKYKPNTSGWIMSLIGLIIGALGILANLVLYIVDPTFLETLSY